MQVVGRLERQLEHFVERHDRMERHRRRAHARARSSVLGGSARRITSVSPAACAASTLCFNPRSAGATLQGHLAVMPIVVLDGRPDRSDASAVAIVIRRIGRPSGSRRGNVHGEGLLERVLLDPELGGAKSAARRARSAPTPSSRRQMAGQDELVALREVASTKRTSPPVPVTASRSRHRHGGRSAASR